MELLTGNLAASNTSLVVCANTKQHSIPVAARQAHMGLGNKVEPTLDHLLAEGETLDRDSVGGSTFGPFYLNIGPNTINLTVRCIGQCSAVRAQSRETGFQDAVVSVSECRILCN